MKVAVMNYPGTVGKTTLTVNLLKGRMKDAEIIAVESINESAADLGVEVRQITGEHFREVFTRLMKTDDAIVDVGASNVEDFIEGMIKYDGSHQEFDFFLVPVTSGTKEQKETLSMFTMLTRLGIPAEKIKIVFNRVNLDVETEFHILFKYATIDPQFKLNPSAVIEENEIYSILALAETTLEAVLADQTDYRTLLRQADPDTDRDLIESCSEALANRSLAVRVNESLNSTFTALFGPAV